jgi:hypothetical protein
VRLGRQGQLQGPGMGAARREPQELQSSQDGAPALGQGALLHAHTGSRLHAAGRACGCCSSCYVAGVSTGQCAPCTHGGLASRDRPEGMRTACRWTHACQPSQRKECSVFCCHDARGGFPGQWLCSIMLRCQRLQRPAPHGACAAASQDRHHASASWKSNLACRPPQRRAVSLHS